MVWWSSWFALRLTEIEVHEVEEKISRFRIRSRGGAMFLTIFVCATGFLWWRGLKENNNKCLMRHSSLLVAMEDFTIHGGCNLGFQGRWLCERRCLCGLHWEGVEQIWAWASLFVGSMFATKKRMVVRDEHHSDCFDLAMVREGNNLQESLPSTLGDSIHIRMRNSENLCENMIKYQLSRIRANILAHRLHSHPAKPKNLCFLTCNSLGEPFCIHRLEYCKFRLSNSPNETIWCTMVIFWSSGGGPWQYNPTGESFSHVWNPRCNFRAPKMDICLKIILFVELYFLEFQLVFLHHKSYLFTYFTLINKEIRGKTDIKQLKYKTY